MAKQRQFQPEEPMAQDRMMPNNIDAEKGVLGSLIIDPEAISQVADFLQPIHFYRDTHAIIYTTILELHEQSSPADFITLSDELEKRGKLEIVGGISYITSLVNRVPTSGNIEYYARIVEQCGIRRRLIHVGGEIVAVAYEETDAAVALEVAEAQIYAIGESKRATDFTSDTDILNSYMIKLFNMKENEGGITGVPSGFLGIDYYLGGLQPSDLVVIAGRPGSGKTGFVISLAHNTVQRYGQCVGMYSLEMSKEQIIQRLVSMETGISLYRLRNGLIEEHEWELLTAAQARLSTNRFWIDDTAGITIAAVKSKARRLKAKQGLSAIIVDYTQLMKASLAGRESNRVLEVGEITMGLKGLAKDLNVPVIALAQLSRKVEERRVKIPQLSDLRESGSLENDADVVMFIYRDEYYNPNTTRPGIADIIIAKHRNGPTGEVQLGFRKEQTRFVNLEEGEEKPSLAETFSDYEG